VLAITFSALNHSHARSQHYTINIIYPYSSSASVFPSLIAPTPARPRLVLLPPVLWAPTASRHKQFPPSFRQAVLKVLCIPRLSRGSLYESTFLSRADVARMRHIWLSSPDQGGDIQSLVVYLHLGCSHCVSLSALTYAFSPTPLDDTSHNTPLVTITQVRFYVERMFHA